MASRRSKSRPTRRTKHAPPAPAKAAETPIIPPQPESAWKDGEVSPDASMTTLAITLLEDFEGDSPFIQHRTLEFLTRMLRSVADDCELVNATGDGLDHTAAIRRVVERIESRARISIEIARRMVVEGGAS